MQKTQIRRKLLKYCNKSQRSWLPLCFLVIRKQKNSNGYGRDSNWATQTDVYSSTAYSTLKYLTPDLLVMSYNVSRWLPLKMRTPSLRMSRITWSVSRGQKQLHFWNPRPRFACSLYNFYWASTTIVVVIGCFCRTLHSVTPAGHPGPAHSPRPNPS